MTHCCSSVLISGGANEQHLLGEFDVILTDRERDRHQFAGCDEPIERLRVDRIG